MQIAQKLQNYRRKFIKVYFLKNAKKTFKSDNHDLIAIEIYKVCLF